MAKLRPMARIVRAIGDQPISGPEAALIELIKNAYDGADSPSVSIKISRPRCDLANAGKVETVLLARCVDISKRWNEVNAKEQGRIGQHGGSHKLHFLPQILDHKGQNLAPGSYISTI